MGKGFLGSALLILANAGFVLAQGPAPASSGRAYLLFADETPASAPDASAPTLPPARSAPVATLGAPAPTLPAPNSVTAQPNPSSDTAELGLFRMKSATPLRFWASAEYLLWWTKGGSTPPLVTTGPPLPVAPSPGSFAAPGTAVLFGGDDRSGGPISGARFALGGWCDDCQTFGIEVGFFFLGQRANDYNASTSGAPGSPVLARPFFDTSLGIQNSELAGYPGLAAGSVRVHATSGLLGADSNLLFNLCRSCDTSCDSCWKAARRYRVDFLAGLTYMDLREGLGIAENTVIDPNAPVFAGQTISAFDQFNTVNRFYGGQVGIRSEYWWNRVFVNATTLVALGDTHQSVDIGGASRITTPGGPTVVLPGDLLAQSSNIGHYARDQFSVVPQLQFNVGYQVTRNVSVFAGYSIIYWTNVERAGDAVSTAVNSTRVPASTLPPSGPFDPQFNFHNSNFWAQGINFGIELRF